MSAAIPSGSTPCREGADGTRRRHLLDLVLLGLAGPGLLFGLAMGCMWALGRAPLTGALAGFGVQPFYLLAHWLSRRGRMRLGAYVPVLILFSAMVGASCQLGVGHVTLVGYALATLTAGVLIDTRVALLFALLSVVAHVVVGMAQGAGVLPGAVAPQATVIADGVGLGLGLAVLVIFNWLSEGQIRRMLERERELSGELRAGRAELEERVAERTASLTVANEQLQGEITERVWAEEALRESEEKYRTLVERANDGICIIQDGIVKYANPRLAEILGVSVEELIGALFTDYVDPDEIPRLVDRYQRRMAGEEVPPIYETLLRCEDGGPLDAEVNAGVIAYQGKPADLVFIRDITERVQAERLLRTLNAASLAVEQALTREEIFAAVAEEFQKLDSHCAVLLTDEGRTRLFPRYFSYEAGALHATKKLTGLTPEDISISIETADVYRRVVRDRETVFVENPADVIRQRLPGPATGLAGQVARVLRMPRSITAPLTVEDEVIGALSVQSDDLAEGDIPAITAFAHQMAAAWRKADLLQDLRDSLEELEETQAQLLQAQKMEAIGRLAGGVAHDFNNILTAIIGYAQLLQRDLSSDDPRQADVEQILSDSYRAASLTRQLLAFSRQQVLQPQVMDLNALVADTEKMLRRLIGEDVELLTVLEERLLRVKADPGQMNQVIMNLVVNGRDAMPHGGRLTIRTENVTLGEKEHQGIPEARPGHFVRLSVEDTGIGMDEEVMAHIFEPFFTTKPRGEGTGLGLSTVYGIVAQHGGWVDVYSEVGRGSVFEVYLPALAVEGEMEAGEGVSVEGFQGQGERVLLVEDDEAVRGTAERMLSEGGYVVFQAAGVREALEVFQRERERVDLLFSDVVLPDGTGLEVVDQLLARKGDLRVLMSSGYSDERSHRWVIHERGLPFIQKPYTWPDLLQAMKEA